VHQACVATPLAPRPAPPRVREPIEGRLEIFGDLRAPAPRSQRGSIFVRGRAHYCADAVFRPAHERIPPVLAL
jgi:hypothetical protein